MACQLDLLEQCLSQQASIGGKTAAWSDVAIFPFIRQFAAVDSVWFEACAYLAMRQWLCGWLDSPLFK